MCSPSDTPRVPRRRPALVGTAGALVVFAVAVAALWLQAPEGARAGVSAPTGRIAVDADATPSAAPSAAAAVPHERGTHRLRCWQYGRLLFDEGPVVLGPEARANARVVGTDRNGAPLIVADAGSTTCLASPR